MKIEEMNLKAVGLIKSRKSDSKIMGMAEKMYELAEAMSVELLDVLIDDTANTDVDRHEITAICRAFENEEASALIVLSLEHITDDEDDLDKFMLDMAKAGILVIDMENKMIIIPSDSDESELDIEK